MIITASLITNKPAAQSDLKGFGIFLELFLVLFFETAVRLIC